MDIELGALAVTAGAHELPPKWVRDAVSRFRRGDWGEGANCEDMLINDWLSENGGGCLHGVYQYSSATLWVIRARDGRSTTVLLPDEY